MGIMHYGLTVSKMHQQYLQEPLSVEELRNHVWFRHRSGAEVVLDRFFFVAGDSNKEFPSSYAAVQTQSFFDGLAARTCQYSQVSYVKGNLPRGFCALYRPGCLVGDQAQWCPWGIRDLRTRFVGGVPAGNGSAVWM